MINFYSALNLLQSKLEETKVTRNELTQTVRNMLGNDYSHVLYS